MSLTPLEALICDLKSCKLARCGIRLDYQDVELILIELEKTAQREAHANPEEPKP